jgi:hypothetical protein
MTRSEVETLIFNKATVRETKTLLLKLYPDQKSFWHFCQNFDNIRKNYSSDVSRIDLAIALFDYYPKPEKVLSVLNQLNVKYVE